MDESLPHINVDFSSTDENGLIFALTDHASAPVAVGLDVIAADDDGNECRARVERLDGSVVYLLPDWDSWTGSTPQAPTETATVRVAATVASSGSFEVVEGTVEDSNGDAVEHAQGSRNLIPS
jgi:hypothetical protein